MPKTYKFLLPILKKQKKLEFVAKEKSMVPLISPGDKVIVGIGNISLASEDNLIAFYNKEIDRVVVHRVKYVKKTNGKIEIITKPDAYNYFDKEKVTKKNYLGKVTKIIKNNKIISLEKNSFSFLKHNSKLPLYRNLLNAYLKILFFVLH